MAKFCGKCGTKLDEKTGLCPKCEKENIAQENVKQKNVVLNRKQRRISFLPRMRGKSCNCKDWERKF